MKLSIGDSAPALDLPRAGARGDTGSPRFDLADPDTLAGRRALVSFHRYAT